MVKLLYRQLALGGSSAVGASARAHRGPPVATGHSVNTALRRTRPVLAIKEYVPQLVFIEEADSALEKAVKDHGLSMDEYDTILQTAQNDPAVREKLLQRLDAQKQ